ncbi:hypothetical protein D3C76_1149500 [compost metagenome]
MQRRIIDNRYLTFTVEQFAHQLARFDTTGVVVGSHVSDHRHALGGHINGNHRNTGFLRFDNRRLYAFGIHRGNNNGVDLLGNKVFYVGELFIQVLIGN